MEINRDVYLERLIVRKHNGLIKIITGIRRRGNSYLLNTLFYNHLIAENIAPDHIIKKIIIVEKSMKPRYDEKGYLMMGVKEFLLDENSLMCDLIYAEMKARGNYRYHQIFWNCIIEIKNYGAINIYLLAQLRFTQQNI